MSSINIEPGSKVSYLGKNYFINKILNLSSVLVSEVDTGKLDTISIKDLNPPIDEITPNNKAVDLLSDKDWKIAQERFAIIQPLIEVRRTKESVEKIAKENGKSIATLYRWIEKYENTGVISSLAPNKKSGGKGQSRLSPEQDEIIKEGIETYYLTPQKSSVQKTCDEILLMFRNAKIKAPHANTIKHRINQISESRKLKARHGHKKWQEKYQPKTGSFPGAETPLSVVQIDHTLVDIMLVDEQDRKPIGRPWITVAIDVFSRMVLGFYISFDPPGSIATGQCVANAILPKEKYLAKQEIEGEWPSWGIMNILHADNAKEFRGKMLQKACKEYNIDIHWRAVAQPNWGGHVERLLGTFSKDIHHLPGTTFESKDKRHNYNSEKKAAFSLPEFEKWLTTYIVNVYHQKFHSGINTNPISKYKEGIFGSDSQIGIGLPSRVIDEKKLRLDFLPYFERTIQYYGVVIDHVYYYHDVLRRWINSTERVNGKHLVNRKFIFKRDPRDISVIFFLDPELEEYFPIPYRDISKPSMSIWEFRKSLKHLKEKGREHIDEEQIFAAYNKLKEIESTSIARTKKAKKSKKIDAIESYRIENSTTILPENSTIDELSDVQPFEELDHETFE